MCFTCGLELNTNSASRPSKPSDFVAKGRLCRALYCSNWIHVGQDVVIGTDAASFVLIVSAAWRTSCQVAGAVSGSRPALRNASLLYHITAVEELNGIEAIRPS